MSQRWIAAGCAPVFAICAAQPSAAAVPATGTPVIQLAQLERHIPPSQQSDPVIRVAAAGKSRPSCVAGIGISAKGGGFQYLQGVKTTSSLGCSYEVAKGLTIAGSINLYPAPGQQKKWDPDFTFRASYRINSRLSLEYGDYSGNRWQHLRPDTLLDGTAWLSYRVPAIKPLRSKNRVVGSVSCSAAAGMPLQPKPGEPTLRGSLSCGITLAKGVSLRATAVVYPLGNQQPWDPDFTYAASYQVNSRITVGYSNYSGNRWFWRKAGQGSGRGGGGGAFSVSFRVL